MSERTDRGDRAPLSRQRIVEVAISMADERGIEALSMRKLAATIGYEAMSLYNHVANKEELVTEMLEVVAAEIPLPRPGDDWDQQLRRSLTGGLHVLQAHPWAAPLWNSRAPGPARLGLMEAMLATLRSGGLSREAVDRGFHALNMHLQGYVLHDQSYNPPREGTYDEALRSFKDGLDPEHHRNILDHIEWHEGNPPSREFEFLLDLILRDLSA